MFQPSYKKLKVTLTQIINFNHLQNSIKLLQNFKNPPPQISYTHHKIDLGQTVRQYFQH